MATKVDYNSPVAEDDLVPYPDDLFSDDSSFYGKRLDIVLRLQFISSQVTRT